MFNTADATIPYDAVNERIPPAKLFTLGLQHVGVMCARDLPYWCERENRLHQDRTAPSFDALCIQPIHQGREKPCK